MVDFHKHFKALLGLHFLIYFLMILKCRVANLISQKPGNFALYNSIYV